MVRTMQGACSGCGRTSSNLRPVSLVTSKTFGGDFFVDNCVLCENCIDTEYFYLDSNDTVKYNRVKVTVESSIEKE